MIAITGTAIAPITMNSPKLGPISESAASTSHLALLPRLSLFEVVKVRLLAEHSACSRGHALQRSMRTTGSPGRVPIVIRARLRAMRDGSPSATARAVAQVRATMDRPVTTEGDGEIERQLVERFPSDRRSPMAEFLERRTEWFDGVTLQALEAGIRQVVIVAAGYDCRALRFRTPGVRFIELDHPSTQADKRRILDDMSADVTDVAYAAADFTVDDVGRSACRRRT